jgi:hypothetical protein
MYWDDARRYWLELEAAADDSTDTRHGAQTLIKPMWSLSLRRPTTPICVTGLGGAGKTILYQTLIGKVGNDYIPPGRSLAAEQHKTVIKNDKRTIRAGAVVVPGQQSQERSIALGKMFENGNFPAGIIHVVCWGYNRIWEAGDRAAVSEQLLAEKKQVNIDSVRDWNRTRELEDFAATCELLKDAWEHHSRLWLIIAVAKCDLFWTDLNLARDYYIPRSGASAAIQNSESEFCSALRDLVQYVGESNLNKLAVVPVSCYPQAYKFDRTVTQQTSSDSARTAALVNRFRMLVGEFCGP